jgi:hypothetical protein
MALFEQSFVPAAVRFADPNPLSNCFKTGTVADLPRVPEDALAVNTRTLEWLDSLTPQNRLHCWMVDQIAITSVRIEGNDRTDRRARDRVVLRAQRFWDDDRRLDAEVLGEGLAAAPALVVNKLRRTPQGCDWMIGRWARLARIADLMEEKGGWDPAQRSLAFDLLGARPEDRDGILGEVIDQEGRVVSSSLTLADLARREVASLQKRKEEVQGLDTLDRALAEADYLAVPTPEIREIRRQNAELHRRLKWYLGQIQAKPAYKATKTAMYRYFQDNPEVAPALQPEAPPAPAEAATTGPTPLPGLTIANDETDEFGVTWPYLVAARRDAQDRKKEALEEARREKRQQLRA